MPLRVQVTGKLQDSLGASYMHEFKACGGTIGRSLECEWAIPDSKRYVSSRHAMIDYQSGAYYLVDLSRNGVFVNGSDAPLGTGNPQRLFDGDTLRIGEYHMEIAIIEDANEAPEDGMRDSIVRAQMVAEDESMEMSMLAPDAIEDAGDFDLMLQPGDESGELSAISDMGDIDDLAAFQTQRYPAESGVEKGAEIFIKSAGLDPLDFKGIDPTTLLQVAARLLCEFADGTHLLLQSKDTIGRKYKLKNKSSDTTANPLRASDGLDSAMRLLLSSRNDVHRSGTDAVKAAFAELKQHQQAVIPALQEALNGYLDRFEPTSLDRYVEELKQRTGVHQTEFRELYAEAYNGLAQRKNGELPREFDAEFSRAYDLESADS
jgi:type VI secretion system protein ImpI